MRPITLKIAPNERVEIPVMGDYLRLDDSAPTCTVEASSNEASGNYAILKGADAIRFPQRFTRLAFYHGEATEQTVTFDVGFGQLLTSRVAGTVAVAGTVDITGTVEVVDGGRVTTLSGDAYAYYAGIAGVAAQYTHLQLWNPVASGKRLVVTAMSIFSQTGAVTFFGGFTNTPLANLGATGARSKLASGGAGVAQRRYETNAASLVAVADRFIYASAVANSTYDVQMREPIIVEPGYGLTFVTEQVNIALGSFAQFTEETIV